jgi:polar amino acid transport system substrate-binding protein
MKKNTVLLFSSLALLGLMVGCTTSSSDSSKNATPLKVGMDLNYPPFETIDNNNIPTGISVDIAEYLGEYLERPVEIVNMGFGSLIQSVNTDVIDIVIASMSITPERALAVDFTDAYLYFQIITLVNQDFATANELTEDSTTEEILAIEDARYAGLATQVSATIPESNGKEVTIFSGTGSLGNAIKSVADGNSDIFLMSVNPVVNGFKANRTETMIIWDSWIASPIGMAVKKGNTELLEEANAFIDTMNVEGGIYDQLRLDWNEVILTLLEGKYDFDFYVNA